MHCTQNIFRVHFDASVRNYGVFEQRILWHKGLHVSHQRALNHVPFDIRFRHVGRPNYVWNVLGCFGHLAAMLVGEATCYCTALVDYCSIKFQFVSVQSRVIQKIFFRRKFVQSCLNLARHTVHVHTVSANAMWSMHSLGESRKS